MGPHRQGRSEGGIGGASPPNFLKFWYSENNLSIRKATATKNQHYLNEVNYGNCIEVRKHIDNKSLYLRVFYLYDTFAHNGYSYILISHPNFKQSSFPSLVLLPSLFCQIANILIWIWKIRIKIFVIRKSLHGTLPNLDILATALLTDHCMRARVVIPNYRSLTSLFPTNFWWNLLSIADTSVFKFI